MSSWKWGISGFFCGNPLANPRNASWFMVSDALWCHQMWLGNPRTKWRFIPGKIIELNERFSIHYYVLLVKDLCYFQAYDWDDEC
jgi:hypothetical protein